jgi:hypothetical protein
MQWKVVVAAAVDEGNATVLKRIPTPGLSQELGRAQAMDAKV